jgi:hypothetical protein
VQHVLGTAPRLRFALLCVRGGGAQVKAIADGDVEVERVDRSYEMFKTQCYGIVQQSIGNLILELETGTPPPPRA